MKLPAYFKYTKEIWWCKSHKRRATYILLRPGIEPTHVCDPNLGGILLCCNCFECASLEELKTLEKEVKKRCDVTIP